RSELDLASSRQIKRWGMGIAHVVISAHFWLAIVREERRSCPSGAIEAPCLRAGNGASFEHGRQDPSLLRLCETFAPRLLSDVNPAQDIWHEATTTRRGKVSNPRSVLLSRRFGSPANSKETTRLASAPNRASLSSRAIAWPTQP